MGNSGIGKSSILRKIVMALSGLFLLVFLVQHLVINLLSVINPDSFNATSHFMGTNPVVQFVAQPILIGGILIHYLMGIILTIQNKKARPVKYIADNQAANSSWVSRNMITTGIMIFLFLILHMGDFWIHEITLKFFGNQSWDVVGFVEGTEEFRYWEELHHTMKNPIKVCIYSLAFLFLGLHLNHGFASTFQSVGFRDGRLTPTLAKLGTGYSIVVPSLFTIIAWCHYFNYYL